MLAETEYRRAIEVTIEPFKGLLLGLYFVSVGAEINPAFIIERPALILGLAVGLIALKGLTLLALARGFRLPARVGHGNGAAARAGRRVRLRDDRRRPGGRPHRPHARDDAHQRGRAVDARNSGAGEARRRIGSAPRATANETPPETPPESEEPRVIIVGYGRVGGLIGDMLDRHKIPFIALDSDARLAARAKTDGKPVYYGDAARPEYLRHCGLETARAVVVTMDSPAANEAVVETTRRLRPDVTLVARARDADHARGALPAWRDGRGARDDRGEPAALRGGAGRYRRADGSGHRLDPREAGRVPQDPGRRRRARAAALELGAATGVSGREARRPATQRIGRLRKPTHAAASEARRRLAEDATFAELARSETSAGGDLALEAAGILGSANFR